MALTVAMAICDMESERANWGSDDFFKHPTLPITARLPKSSSTWSLASSTGASSYHSVESGISSMSPDCLSYQDHPLVCLEQTKNNFYQCEFLTQNPVNNGAGDYTAIMNQLKSKDSNEDQGPRDHFEVPFARNVASALVEAEARPQAISPKWSSMLMHGKRNVLDLGDNLRNDQCHWNFQYAQLPQADRGTFYFDNRSQYSRVGGAYPPECPKQKCPFGECGFVENIYP